MKRSSQHNTVTVHTTSVPAAAMKERDAARYLGVSCAFLRSARVGRTTGPPFVRAGRMVLYRVAAMDEWLAAHEVHEPVTT